MSKDKTKEFTNFIKQDFDIVKDYKNASKELTPLEEKIVKGCNFQETCKGDISFCTHYETSNGKEHCRIDPLYVLEQIANHVVYEEIDNDFKLNMMSEMPTEFRLIKQALTDYTKQTELLVELREKMASHIVVNLVTSYNGKPDCKLCKSLFELGETATYVPTFEDIILQDINTILEGGKV